jgi:hypothetical protein
MRASTTHVDGRWKRDLTIRGLVEKELTRECVRACRTLLYWRLYQEYHASSRESKGEQNEVRLGLSKFSREKKGDGQNSSLDVRLRGQSRQSLVASTQLVSVGDPEPPIQ